MHSHDEERHRALDRVVIDVSFLIMECFFILTEVFFLYIYILMGPVWGANTSSCCTMFGRVMISYGCSVFIKVFISLLHLFYFYERFVSQVICDITHRKKLRITQFSHSSVNTASHPVFY